MAEIVFWVPSQQRLDSAQPQVVGLGIREQMGPSLVHRPLGTPDYLLIFFHDPVEAYLDDCPLQISANTLMIWEPNTCHRFGNEHERWAHSWVHCSGSATGRLIVASGLPIGQPVSSLAAVATERLLQAMLEELRDGSPPDALILASYFQIWLREILRSSVEPDARSVPNNMLKVRVYINQDFREEINVKQLASMANYSVSQFLVEFKRHFRSSPMEYVLQVRMERAVYLLHDCNLPIYRVANLVGYSDALYFSRLFKRRLGVGPQEYRRTIVQRMR